MGKGSSGLSGGTRSVTSVMTQSGVVADLTGIPLRYGGNDNTLSNTQRQNIEAWEQKRVKMKTEYAVMLDEDGIMYAPEVHGTATGARIPSYWGNAENSVLSHNHPRGKGEEGSLGGSFSEADLKTFSRGNYRTIRATATEGTYSLSKR